MSEKNPDNDLPWIFIVVFLILFVGDPSIFESVRVLLAKAAGLAH